MIARPFRLTLAGLLLAFAIVPAVAQDAADALVRIQNLEAQLRRLNGQVEQLQFQNRQLEDQLRKFQNDTEFRFGELGGRPRPATPSPAGRSQRGDAFDPALQPAAPGSPRDLGTPGVASAPLTAGRRVAPGVVANPGEIIAGDPVTLGRDPTEPLDLEGQGSLRGPGPIASGVALTPREEIEQAQAFYAAGDYERAEAAFREFLRNRPRDRLAPDAMVGLGDSLYQRQRWREAAEQFVDYTTKYPRATRGAEAQLKLGVSLRNLGALQEACAVLTDVGRKYPNASTAIKQGVTREQQRARCT